MDFEFDPNKSKSNKAKHGIDFLEAQSLWNDFALVEIPVNVKDEDRSLLIGMIEGKLWAAVITHRDNNIRIISVRRAREEERALYES